MKLIILACLLVISLTSPGIDFYDNLLEDPLNWADAPMPREFLGNSLKGVLMKLNKSDPEFQSIHKKIRTKFFKIKDNEGLLGRPWQLDSPEVWFRGQTYISNIYQIPTSGKASIKPWSSFHWPIEYGVLSSRYEDNEKNTFFDSNGEKLTWKQSINKYHEPQDYQEAISSGVNIEEYIASYFSASEKYDLLISDLSFTLTNQNKLQGEPLSKNGDVEFWMGICHGWAPVSLLYSRPQRDVVMVAGDGTTKIKFYADDVRGLLALKYASTEHDNMFVGGRCNLEEKDIKKDPETGLITDYACFDVNPATWTIIIGNTLGLQGKSFIIDATFDLQVWNQPVYSYEMTYFNILKNSIRGDLNSTKISLSQLASSPKKLHQFLYKRANKQASSIIGVSMDLTYVGETYPSHDPPGPDNIVKVSYVYSLELDEKDNIIGGEWMHNQHPDFLWMTMEGAKAMNEEDEEIERRVSGSISDPSILNKVREYGVSAAQRGEVLDIVIDFLARRSAGEEGYMAG